MKKIISTIDSLVYRFWLFFLIVLFSVSLVAKAMYNMNDSPYFVWTRGIDIILIVVIIVLYCMLFKKADWIEKNIPYWGLIVFFGAIAISFVLLLPIYPISDMKYVSDGTLMLAKGDIAGIKETDYLQSIVYNLKVSAFYALFVSFLPKTVISIRLVNVALYILTFVATGKICKNIFNKFEKTGVIITASVIPLIAFTNNIYFDLPVLCLGSWALYFYTRNKNLKNMIISAVFLGITANLRISAYVFAIAIVIDFVFSSIKNNRMKEKRTLLCLILFIAIVLVIPYLGDVIVKHFFRTEESENVSIWPLFWMGINEPEFGMMHNEYAEYTQMRFHDFWSLLTSRSFKQNCEIFGKKILWMWTQGTYQCQRYGFGYDMDDPSLKYIYQTFLTGAFMKSTYIIPATIIVVARAQYMALFFLMMVGIAHIVKNKEYDKYRTFTYLFFGTFLILILYEMKARYVFHLLTLMIVFAVLGLKSLQERTKIKQIN